MAIQVSAEKLFEIIGRLNVENQELVKRVAVLEAQLRADAVETVEDKPKKSK